MDSLDKLNIPLENNNTKKIHYSLQLDDVGYWFKKEYNDEGKLIHYVNSGGYWFQQEYNSRGNIVYYDDCDGYWYKCEFDSNGKQIYFENSETHVKDDRKK